MVWPIFSEDVCKNYPAKDIFSMQSELIKPMILLSGHNFAFAITCQIITG